MIWQQQWRVVIQVLFTFAFLAAPTWAGELSGRITRLLGDGRADTEIDYRIMGRNPNTNQQYTIQETRRFLTGDGSEGYPEGAFRIRIPEDRLRSDSHEVFVIFSGIGLETVEVPYLLGTGTHNVTVVMKEALYRRFDTRARLVLHGRCSTFHLIDGIGTVSYTEPSSGQLFLAELQMYKIDENYIYLNEIDGNQRWAVALKCTRQTMRRTFGRTHDKISYRIYRHDNGQPEAGWRLVDFATRVIPANADDPGSSYSEMKKLLHGSDHIESGEP